MDGFIMSNFLYLTFVLYLTSDMIQVHASFKKINEGPNKGMNSARHKGCHETKKANLACMFTFDCMRAKGSPVGVCMDGIFVRSCCKLPFVVPVTEESVNSQIFSPTTSTEAITTKTTMTTTTTTTSPFNTEISSVKNVNTLRQDTFRKNDSDISLSSTSSSTFVQSSTKREFNVTTRNPFFDSSATTSPMKSMTVTTFVNESADSNTIESDIAKASETVSDKKPVETYSTPVFAQNSSSVPPTSTLASTSSVVQGNETISDINSTHSHPKPSVTTSENLAWERNFTTVTATPIPTTVPDNVDETVKDVQTTLNELFTLASVTLTKVPEEEVTTVGVNSGDEDYTITTLQTTIETFNQTAPSGVTITKPPQTSPTQGKHNFTDSTTPSASSEESTFAVKPYNNRVDCGVRPLYATARIVGGRNAHFGEWPWQVLIKEATWLGLLVKTKCGGVLIHPNWVLTAAHCQPGFFGSLVAIVGEYDLTGDVENLKPVAKPVKRMIVHRDYNANTFENDIALLELESSFQIQPHVIPICLPEDGDDFIGQVAHVTGWGKLNYGGAVPSILQVVKLPILPNSQCQQMFLEAGHVKAIRDTFVCAGYPNGGKDACEGDSGGPLMVQRSDGHWVLVGTVSHGIKCAEPNLPGVYMRTTAYKPWIKVVTKTVVI